MGEPDSGDSVVGTSRLLDIPVIVSVNRVDSASVLPSNTVECEQAQELVPSLGEALREKPNSPDSCTSALLARRLADLLRAADLGSDDWNTGQRDARIALCLFSCTRRAARE